MFHLTKQALPSVKLVQVYGLSETGFLSGLQDPEHAEDKLMSCGRTCLGVDVRVVNHLGKKVQTGQTGEGDIGCHDADGYFYLLDRLKEIIVISAHPAVREVAVFGKPDPKWGEKGLRCAQVGENADCRSVDRIVPSLPGQPQSSSEDRVFRNRTAQERLGPNTKESLA